MLYIVGGVARSGKTALSLKMHREKQVSYFPLDYLRSGFHWALPDLGINHDDEISGVAEKMWPFLYAVLRSFAQENIDYLVEGDSLLPCKVAELANEMPGKVCACFLGYPKADPEEKLRQVRINRSEVNNWQDGETDDGLKSYLEKMVIYSQSLQQECEECGIPFFDMSKDFQNGLQKAFNFLTSKGKEAGAKPSLSCPGL